MEPDEKETRTRRRQAMQVRQVVTGHDAEGRAVFVQDKQVDVMPIPHLARIIHADRSLAGGDDRPVVDLDFRVRV
jgi:hypothetical protein